MKKLPFFAVFIVFVFPALSLENHFFINMEVPFAFEVSKYYDNPQTTMLVGIGLNITDRIFFCDNVGMNAHISLTYPFFATTIMEHPDPEIFDANYHLPSNILSFGPGITYRNNYFNLDAGPQIRLFTLKNLFAEYSNFTTGFYINPSISFFSPSASFELGLTTGVDLYSNSTIKLLLNDNRELKYKGGYTMFYFGLYFGFELW